MHFFIIQVQQLIKNSSEQPKKANIFEFTLNKST